MLGRGGVGEKTTARDCVGEANGVKQTGKTGAAASFRSNVSFISKTAFLFLRSDVKFIYKDFFIGLRKSDGWVIRAAWFLPCNSGAG